MDMMHESSADVTLESFQVERVLDDFEEAWRRGAAPRIEQYLTALPAGSANPASRRELLAELVMIDLWHRWSLPTADVESASTTSFDGKSEPHPQLSWRPSVEDYVRCYPQLGPCEQVPLALIGEEHRARLHYGEPLSHAQYVQRFPHHGEALDRLLTQLDDNLRADTINRLGCTSRLPPNTAARPPSTDRNELPVPASIGKYRVISALGHGGQASVYRAIHPTLGKEVVVKLCHGADWGQLAEGDRLMAEGRVLAELEHRNLIRVYDLDFHEGQPFLVMEYVQGVDLRRYAVQNALGPREAARLVARVARAAAVAHRRGIVHQDIKPTNILIDEQGEPCLIDFGLARICRAWGEDAVEQGTASGTIPFMAPEQARGEAERISPRTDIFALGAVLYYLLAGKAPFDGANVSESLTRASQCQFDAAALNRRGIPRRLQQACLRAMQADPARRFTSADDFAAELERAVRRPRVTGLVIGLPLVALLAVLLGWWMYSSTRQPVQLNLVSRPLRQDFRLTVSLLGDQGGTPGRIVLTAGQRVAFRAESDRDAYLGIWHVDRQGRILQLFPNQYDKDHFLQAGHPRTIPGDLKYAIRATLSDGPEYLHVIASSKPWEAEAGQQHGPYVVFATPEERERWQRRVRGVVLEKDTSPAVSELVLPFEVRQR
jgi:serine/threonine protein kinase